jgi:hypothetical protein
LLSVTVERTMLVSILYVHSQVIMRLTVFLGSKKRLFEHSRLPLADERIALCKVNLSITGIHVE